MSKRMVSIAMAAGLVVGSVTVGALVASDRDDGPEPLRLAAGGTAEAAADTAAGMALRLPSEYRLADGFQLPALDGERAAYRLSERDGEAKAARLADAFDLGELQPLPADEGEGWRAEGDAGTLTVRSGGGLAWDYSIGYDEPGVVGGSEPGSAGSGTSGSTGSGEVSKASESCDMPPCPEGQACIQMCPDPEVAVRDEAVEPEPPANLLSEADAEQRARDLLETAGVDLAGAAITARADGWATQVEVNHAVDGEPVAGLLSSFTFGDGGRLEWASGFLGEVVRADRYPLAGTARGFERLQAFEQVYPAVGMGGVVALAADAPVSDAAHSTALVDEEAGSDPTTEEAPAPCPPEADCVIAEPLPDQPVEEMPVEEMPVEEMEPVVFTVTAVEVRLAALPAADGGTLIVPVYAFTMHGPEGEPFEEMVVALTDEHLAGTTGSPGVDRSGAGAIEPAPLPADDPAR